LIIFFKSTKEITLFEVCKYNLQGIICIY